MSGRANFLLQLLTPSIEFHRLKEAETRAAMLEKILIPTDLTLAGNSAFPIGVTLAQAFSSRLYLVHVMHPDALQEPERLEDFPRLSRFFATDRIAPDLPPLKATVPVGKVYRHHRNPEQVILDFAKRKEMDLICMATTQENGKFKIPWWSLGGMTGRIIRQAPCSVLCLRGQPVKQQDWQRPRFKHILLLAELGPRGAAPLLKALPWVHMFNSMLHIFPLIKDVADYLPSEIPLREVAQLNSTQTNVLLFANPARQTQNLMAFLKQTQIDLIILPARARAELSTPLVSDILARLLADTNSPVLVLR